MHWQRYALTRLPGRWRPGSGCELPVLLSVFMFLQRQFNVLQFQAMDQHGIPQY